MRILALETTERIGSIAVFEGGQLVRLAHLAPQQESARSLAPGMKRLLDDVRWRPRDVELVAVSIGPGSFTGLRVGLATAKTFAYAIGAQVLGIGTLEAIAAAATREVAALSVGVDAQRGQVAAGEFRRGSDGWFAPAGPWQLLDADTWLAGLPPEIWVSGPALRRYSDRVPPGVKVLPSELWAPDAAQVGRLAFRDWEAGRRDDLWTLAPIYSRRSAAEEKWEQRHGAGGRGKELPEC